LERISRDVALAVVVVAVAVAEGAPESLSSLSPLRLVFCGWRKLERKAVAIFLYSSTVPSLSLSLPLSTSPGLAKRREDR